MSKLVLFLVATALTAQTPAPAQWQQMAPKADDVQAGPKMPVPPQAKAMRQAAKAAPATAKAAPGAEKASQGPAKAPEVPRPQPKDEKAPDPAAMGIPVEYRPLPDVRSKTPIPGKPVRLVRVPTSSVRIDRVKPYMRVYYWPPLPEAAEPSRKSPELDESGKPMKEITYGVILDPVYFPFNESEMVAPSSYLERIVQWLKADGDHGLTLTGHADPRGAAARNQRLSVERAETVKAALVRLGAPEGQIKVAGVGSSKPAKKGKTQEAKHWGSRRVEFDLHPLAAQGEKVASNSSEAK